MTARAKPKPPPHNPLFLIRWRELLEPSVLNEKDAHPPSKPLLRAFTNRQAAEQYLHAAGRGEIPLPAHVNPFHCFRLEKLYPDKNFAGLAGLTSFPEPVFLDWVRELGLEPPELTRIKPRYAPPITMRDWAGWWDQHAPTMTELQRGRIWHALDKLEFFEIVETGLEE